MFKKKPNIKPLAPLRSSDRRRTADLIISDLDLQVPLPTSDDAEAKAAATAAHSALRNSLLPDNTLSARFTTTHGPDLKQISGTVYVGAHAGDDQRVLWIKFEDRMYPTVYTLWRNPRIVPLLHTHPVVVDKLQTGADLMTPGLAWGPPFPDKARKGTVVAVANTAAPSAPVVVGVCEIDVADVTQVTGAKGLAVRTVHWAEDEIWAWSQGGKTGGGPPREVEGWLVDEGGEVGELADETERLVVQDEEPGGVSLDAEAGRETQEEEAQPEEEDLGLGEEVEDRELTREEIDEAFCKAFLYGVHHYKSNNEPPNYGLEFPLNQSVFLSTLVQPFLPAFTPLQTSSLQIKKSSYKNVKKFIKGLEKMQILKSKDRAGNETVVLDIDFDDAQVTNFKPYRLPRKETAAGTSVGRGTKATEKIDPNDSAVGQTVKIISLFRPKEKLAPLFAASSSDPRAYYTAADLRPIINAYLEKENLISDKARRAAKLDPFLANAVFDGRSPLDNGILAKGLAPREVVVERILAGCSPYYVIARTPAGEPDAPPDVSKPRAGAPPKVLITLETRSGNKTATKISGLEAFGIAPQALADELRKVCAGSTSVERLVGSSPKAPVMEVMVQGPQAAAVGRALERRGVSQRWVEVVDKTKGRKK
ncbi:hypothetical protein EJ06DRAFT_544744 [Trichodelitschia bisporula]|uniref:SUI1 domain-containing protein n=1 Tax=Trichodelitschia bisporula TaxID=703511 RepID=A0A6G1HN41_9PEZI|nr:hypothetical protein EJ06DRAFT_544744 [Trichodelitschia bisporula]